MNDTKQHPTESSEADDLFDSLHRVLEKELSFSSHFTADSTESSPAYVVEYLSGGATSPLDQKHDEINGGESPIGTYHRDKRQNFPILYQGANFGPRVTNVPHQPGGRPLPSNLHAINKVYTPAQDYQQRPAKSGSFDPSRDGMGYAPPSSTLSQVATAALAAAANGSLTEMKRRKGAYNMSHLLMDSKGFLPFERFRDYIGKAHAVVINNLEPKTNSNNLLSIFFPLGATDALAVGGPIGNEDAVRMFGTRRGGIALFSSADMAIMAAEKIDDFVPSGQSQPLRAFFFGSFADYDTGKCATRIRDAFYMPINSLAMSFMEPEGLQSVLLVAISNCENEAKDASTVVAERLAHHPSKYLRMVTNCIYIVSRGGIISHSINGACVNAFFTSLSSFVIQKGVMSKTASRSLRLACGIVCAHLFDTEVLSGGSPYLMGIRLGGSVVTEMEKQAAVRDRDPSSFKGGLLSQSSVVLLETVVAMIMTWESLQKMKKDSRISGGEEMKDSTADHRRQYLAMIKKVIDTGCAPDIILSIYGRSDAIFSENKACDKKMAEDIFNGNNEALHQEGIDLTIRKLSLSTTSSVSVTSEAEEEKKQDVNSKLPSNHQLQNAIESQGDVYTTYDWEAEVSNSMIGETTPHCNTEVEEDKSAQTHENIPSSSGSGCFVVTSSERPTSLSYNRHNMSVDSALSRVSSVGPVTRNAGSAATLVRSQNSFTVSSGSLMVTPEKIWSSWAAGDTTMGVCSSKVRGNGTRSINTSQFSNAGSHHDGSASPASVPPTYMMGPHNSNIGGMHQGNTTTASGGPCITSSINQLSSYVLMCTVYMTKVPVYLDASSMRKVFFYFGDINKVRIYEDREANNNNSKSTPLTTSDSGGFSTRGSFGFVEFATPQSSRAMVDFFRNPSKSVSSMFLITEEELAAVLTMRVSFARSSIHDQDAEDAIYAQTSNRLSSTPEVVKMKGCSFGL
eukprot:Tbor_TRINITY_DN5081_c0_g1::TRINITY_DN5081_c0_g1_i1::g.14040::m.14040